MGPVQVAVSVACQSASSSTYRIESSLAGGILGTSSAISRITHSQSKPCLSFYLLQNANCYLHCNYEHLPLLLETIHLIGPLERFQFDLVLA